MDFVGDGLHDVELDGFDLLNVKLFMGNFFVYCLHPEWIDIFKLGSDEHGSNSGQMQVGHLLVLFRVFEKAVHQRYGEEKCLVVAPEVG